MHQGLTCRYICTHFMSSSHDVTQNKRVIRRMVPPNRAFVSTYDPRNYSMASDIIWYWRFFLRRDSSVNGYIKTTRENSGSHVSNGYLLACCDMWYCRY
jgi:hypothetical protein